MMLGALVRLTNHADLIVIESDPATPDLDELPETMVLRLVLGGRTAYDSGTL